MKFRSLAALGILVAVALVAGCGPSHSGQSGQSKASRSQNGSALANDSAGHALRPGDAVMITKMGYGCQSRNILARAIQEQNLGRITELQTTIGNYPACITQSEFPAQHWTVVAVHSPVVQIAVVGFADVREFKKVASRFGKSGAQAYKNRYWIPPQWLLKLHPQ